MHKFEINNNDFVFLFGQANVSHTEFRTKMTEYLLKRNQRKRREEQSTLQPPFAGASAASSIDSELHSFRPASK